MNNSIQPAVAEMADHMLQLVALSMFAVSIMFALSVAEFFASESLTTYLDMASKLLAVAILLSMGVVFFWKFRNMDKLKRRQYLAEDGFLQMGFQRAMAKSWMISFIVLVMLQVLDNLILKRLPELPLELVIQAILSFMLAIFSVAFFIYTRTSPMGDSTGEHE